VIDCVPEARAWCSAVAEILGLEAPKQATIIVHDEPGVARTEGQRIHLYGRPEGGVDVDQLPHELVHLVAGVSPTRFVSEGLAVHVAAELGLGQPCWPSYLLKPTTWVVAQRLRGVEPPTLDELIDRSQSLSVTAAMRVGPKAVEAAWTLYIAAGAFVGHLFESLPRDEFWEGYRRGGFWSDAKHLTTLEQGWLAALPAGLDPGDEALLADSLACSRRQLSREL